MPVTVVGSLNEDVLVAVERLPGRGETVVGRGQELAPGGKGANQAAAAGRLGADVAMVGRVGDDAAGERQRAALLAAGVDVTLVLTTPGQPTGTATIPVEDGTGENLIVVVPGANAALTAADVEFDAVRRADVVLLQLEVPMAAVQAAAAAAQGLVVLTPAPPRPLPAELLERVDVLVPNEHELLALAGAEPGERGPAELARLARELTCRAVVVTRGAAGALVVPPDGPHVVQPAPAVEAVDTTGAGDCFCGALAQALGGGAELRDAVRFAVAAAALSTTGPGARGALPDAAAVARLVRELPPPAAGGPVRRLPTGPIGHGGGVPSSPPGGPAMTDPDRDHTGEPAEGAEQPGADSEDGRTPHTEQPAEGGTEAAGGGADTPDR